MRVIKTPKRYGQVEMTIYALTVVDEVIEMDPRSYKEAMESIESHKWV